VVFTVTISKGDSVMGFKCVGGGDYVRISHVELDDTGDADQYLPYTGGAGVGVGAPNRLGAGVGAGVGLGGCCFDGWGVLVQFAACILKVCASSPFLLEPQAPYLMSWMRRCSRRLWTTWMSGVRG